MEQNPIRKQSPQTSKEPAPQDSMELISQESDQETCESHLDPIICPTLKEQTSSQLSTLDPTNPEKKNLALGNQANSKQNLSNQNRDLNNPDVCLVEPRTSGQKKETDKNEKKMEITKNQRQSKKQQREISKNGFLKPKQPKEDSNKEEYEDEWTIQSDNENQFEGQTAGDENQTAIIEDEEIKNLTALKEQDQLNNAYIQKQATLKYEHWLQNKHLLVLYLVFRKEIYDMFPKNTSQKIDIHPANKNKIIIFATSHEEIKTISAKISQFINKIAIVKLNIRNEEATRLKSSKTLNERLLREKLVIFKYGSTGEKSFYIGGKGSQPQLSNVFKELRSLKFRYFRMFDFRNTRSYNIIVGHFIKQKQLLKGFNKWSLKNIEIVPYIPSFNQMNPKKDREKVLCLLLTTVGHLQNLSPKQIENSLCSYIQNNYYSVVLVFKKGQKYLPKLSVDGVTFKYVFQKRFSWAYLYIMSTKKQFFIKRDQIVKEIEKLSQKNLIFGARFFDSLSPKKSQCAKPEICRQIRFPDYEPYSTSFITKKKTQQKFTENGCNKQGSEVHTEQQNQTVWHQFDWKAHLLSFKEKPLEQK